ncbi:MAG: flavocytochrome c [Fusobacteriaceae bacterium]
MKIKLFLFTLITTITLATSIEPFKEGIYLGSANGYKGKVKVEVKLSKNKIEDIKVISNTDTPVISEAPVNIIPKRILKTQGLGVDMVAGATSTSRALVSAVNNAIKSSGYKTNLRRIKSEKPNFSDNVITHDNDVVVIGAGGAGLIAAIEAKLNGANVCVIEKMEFPGGNTLISGAEYAAPNNWVQTKEGLKDSKDLFYNDIIKGGDNESNPTLAKILSENALSGAEVITKLIAKAKELEIPIYLGTNAVELIEKDNRIIGVKSLTDTETHNFMAKKSVIIASGGFGSNVSMRKKYDSRMDEKILSTNTKGITGDGILMGEKIGAATTDMEFIQTYPICDPENGSLLYTGDVRLAGSAILVNKEGKRFVEELDRRDTISFAITKQTGGVGYLFWDQNQLDKTGVAVHHKGEYDALLRRKILVKADTIEEAAKYFDINSKELKITVEKYNDYAKDGKDLEFNKRGGLVAFTEGPYYILKNTPAIHHTMGGLVIDSQTRVLDTKGNPIQGLYAAGEVTGDIHGKNRLGSNAIADITVFGKISGKTAAKN